MNYGQRQIFAMSNKPRVYDAVLAEVDGKVAYWTVGELVGLDRAVPDKKSSMDGEDYYVVRTKRCKS